MTTPLSARLCDLLDTTTYVIDDSGDGVICPPDRVITLKTGNPYHPIEHLEMSVFLDIEGNTEDAALWSSPL